MDNEDKVVDTITAHKVILAVHSEYFRVAFFGTGASFKEDKDGIVMVKETTKQAFWDLMGFIYEKDIDFENKSLTELFEILNLAQRFQVDKLKEVVSKNINNFPLTMDNVVMVAATAQELSHFEEVSKNLMEGCVDLLSKRLVDVKSVLAVISKNGDGSTVLKLLKDFDLKMKSICNNCGSFPCRTSINPNDLAPGQIIPNRFIDHRCKVIRILNSGEVAVDWVNPLGEPSVNSLIMPLPTPKNTYPLHHLLKSCVYKCNQQLI